MRSFIILTIALVTGCRHEEPCEDITVNNYITVESSEQVEDTDIGSDTADSGDTDTDVEDTDTGFEPCSTTERRLVDADGDGYGDPNNYVQVNVCDAWEAGYVDWTEGRDDCDDANATIHPGAIEFLGDGVDNDCDGSGACEYQVESENHGVVIIENEIRVTLSSSSPSGSAIPGYGELLRVSIASLHPECGAVTVTGLNLRFNHTDNAVSGWGPYTSGLDVRNQTQDPSHPIMIADWVGGNDYPALGSLLMMPGSSYALTVYGDTTGASSAQDDSVRVDLESVQFVAGFNIVTSHEFNNLVITGNTLVY